MCGIGGEGLEILRVVLEDLDLEGLEEEEPIWWGFWVVRWLEYAFVGT